MTWRPSHDEHRRRTGGSSKRGLAAVMFADMVGYTALMGRDEAAARAQRDHQRAVVDELVGKYGGRVRQHYGDGTLATFPSAVDAAWCALRIQGELRQEPVVPIRIGLHTGDIVDEEDGIYGDGVNLAARIQGVAESGGVAASHKFVDEIRNQRGLRATSLGSHALKNVDRPVEVFALEGEPPATPAATPPSRHAEAEERPRRGSRPLGKAAAAALLVAGVAVAFWIGSRSDVERAARSPTSLPSVAVLPFRDLNAAEENAAFFADGVHDDILTQLTKLGALEVIARTSVMRYVDATEPIPEIGRELGVDAILEGGVQRAGNRIRLNVQLIDARTDTHLWAEAYDRELTAENVFAIQSEVAEAIAREMRAVLTGDERAALAAVPTTSMEAYEHYLRGSMTLRDLGGLSDLVAAEEALTQAVRLDPSFAEAYARLSYTHLSMYWNAYDRSDRRRDLAREALERAEALEASDPEVLIARGYYAYWGFRDYASASLAFGEALRVRPNDARVYEARAYVLRRSGSWLEAVRDLETAVGLDPMNSELVRALGQTYLQLRDYSRAEGLLDRALALQPGRRSALFDRGQLDLMRDGDLTRLRVAMTDPRGARELSYIQWWLALIDRSEEVAFAISAALPGPLQQQASIHPPSLLNSLVHWRMGRQDAARAAADSAVAVLQALRESQPEDPRVHAALGRALALRGDGNEAVREGREAVRLLPTSADATDGPEYVLQLAEIHALLGERDEAVEALRRALSVPNTNSLASVLASPVAATLAGHPGLAAIADAERMVELKGRG